MTKKLRATLITGATVAPLLLASCSLYTANDLRRATQYEYERGVAAEKAAQARLRYHEEQRDRENPYTLGDTGHSLLPPKRRFYEVPIPEHTASDGVLIEAHTAQIEVIQP